MIFSCNYCRLSLQQRKFKFPLKKYCDKIVILFVGAFFGEYFFVFTSHAQRSNIYFCCLHQLCCCCLVKISLLFILIKLWAFLLLYIFNQTNTFIYTFLLQKFRYSIHFLHSKFLPINSMHSIFVYRCHQNIFVTIHIFSYLLYFYIYKSNS